MEQYFAQIDAKCMIRIPTHDLGISTSGCARYQMHPTGLDWNVVLTRSLQYMRATQGRSGIPRIEPNFFTLLEIPYEWKVHMSTPQDLPTLAGQSSKE